MGKFIKTQSRLEVTRSLERGAYCLMVIEFLFWGDEKVWAIVVMVAQDCERH